MDLRIDDGPAPAEHSSDFRSHLRYLVLDRLLREERALGHLPSGDHLREQISYLALALGEPGEQLVRQRAEWIPLRTA
ncbi:MAG: hypothetical protein JWM76_556 [Pseudonocardiales bacterium]|nr:hypothetical protein [Pseudonocardiales bacterium]